MTTNEQSAEKGSRSIIIPRPQIHTGPKHLTVDEATVDYLREAAKRVRRERYWGSGVTALVSDLLDVVADAVEVSAPPAESRDCDCDYWHSKHRNHCATNFPSTPPGQERQA